MKKFPTAIIIILAILLGAFATYYAYVYSLGTKNSFVIRPGDTVYMNYVGKLPSGTIFDSSYDDGEPYGFTAGIGMVIKGWDEGVIGLRAGDKKTLVIPPEKAYGSQGVSDGNNGYVVPPDSQIIIDLEIVKVDRNLK